MAATIRTFDAPCRPWPPTRSTARSWIARSSLACAGQRQVGDLVEEQRAAVGVLELAAPAPHAGGGAVLDAEQLGLEQRLDERGAVDRHERPGAARAQLVDLPGDQFLARAALALDEHGEVGGRHALPPVRATPASARSHR